MRIVRNMDLPSAGARESGCGADGACGDVRCGCGSLLARVVGGEVELKCRRCKQVWRLAIEGAPRDAAGRWRLLEGRSR